MNPFEPDVLRLGKEFGRVVAIEYPRGMAEGDARAEAHLRFGSGARWLPGEVRDEARHAQRVDLLLEIADDESGLPALVVLEVKNTDWDRQKEHRVRPNALRHTRQVWRYLDALAGRLDRGEVAWLQAALVYPRRPRHPPRAAYLEQLLGEHGITAVWYDEIE